MEKILESFNQLDENDLRIVLDQVGRRMLSLRLDTPDVSFWYNILMRVNKWLATELVISEAEKRLLLNPPINSSGRVQAIKSMRERTGSNITTCMKIVDKWVESNLNIVHSSVRENHIRNNREKNGT